MTAPDHSLGENAAPSRAGAFDGARAFFSRAIARGRQATASMPRMLGWAIAALVLAAVVWALAPVQLPVTVYKLSLVSVAAVAGYWLDRSLFPYGRPDEWLDRAAAAVDMAGQEALLATFRIAMLRRAIVVAAAMLAVGLGA